MRSPSVLLCCLLGTADGAYGDPMLMKPYGVTPGDLLSAIDGRQITGRPPREVIGQPRWFSARKSITFTGHRGLFRQSWSVTIDVEEATAKKKQAAAETAAPDASRSDIPAAERQTELPPKP